MISKQWYEICKLPKIQEMIIIEKAQKLRAFADLQEEMTWVCSQHLHGDSQPYVTSVLGEPWPRLASMGTCT